MCNAFDPAVQMIHPINKVFPPKKRDSLLKG